MAKQPNDEPAHEARLLLRYACERVARSLHKKASASRIRIVAKMMFAAAIRAAEQEKGT